MKKTWILVAGLIVAGIFFAHHTARASCTSYAALAICYDRCDHYFNAALAPSCKVGCYIGCLTDGTN
jgi:hypothetical protein